MRALTRYVTLLTLPVAVAGCNPMIAGSETERALCEAWRDSLPTRSRSDTAMTQAEIGVAYDVQAAACPRYVRFPK